MPHFVIDCASSILELCDEATLNEAIHKVAHSTDLFVESDIKVRVNSFDSYLVGNKQEPFIHVFTHIMQGRTTEQKAVLSKAVVTKLNEMFPDIKNIAMNINDFEKATYFNKTQL
ncbi:MULTISPECIES: 5-carboxymethyl-2-hydroxymuconate Delta-isomerase [unclassified Pseudoalteromonas]|uniref:5-carboxymethyl-2-hydroxymuconate Delta-isomerase n=1 Tax=unclassified Pseudoalteromonas TaxID=194690 RepID=UPI0025B4B0D2|nr:MULTISPECIES: 5-carboxymethyl-2-hydroxymuconate Delta-isomerase [unclassified Pseudoalteromonas]MDN3379243.1 5-carboxymethyl-2-hydroxymuconate Delta-isomerase [Pseudoalteromonas sp. APC 3893]MDN3386417.1 5-carboxymethyl-2-hydroxymuconate Delta-isomerase [Pseudoalteromonas sp. APC 4017]